MQDIIKDLVSIKRPRTLQAVVTLLTMKARYVNAMNNYEFQFKKPHRRETRSWQRSLAITSFASGKADTDNERDCNSNQGHPYQNQDHPYQNQGHPYKLRNTTVNNKGTELRNTTANNKGTELRNSTANNKGTDRISDTDEPPYGCGSCKNRYRCPNSLSYHMKTLGHTLCHLHRKRCPSICQNDRQHSPIVIKRELQEFVCPNCFKSFAKPQALRMHGNVHSGEKPYKCNDCDRRFRLRSTLRQHERLHTGEKPFQCKFCESRFAQKTSLNYHHASRHGYLMADSAGAGDKKRMQKIKRNNNVVKSTALSRMDVYNFDHDEDNFRDDIFLVQESPLDLSKMSRRTIKTPMEYKRDKSTLERASNPNDQMFVDTNNNDMDSVE